MSRVLRVIRNVLKEAAYIRAFRCVRQLKDDEYSVSK